MNKTILSLFFCLICYFSVAQELHDKEKNLFKEDPYLQKLLDSSLANYYDSDFNNSKKNALQLLKEAFKRNNSYFSANAYNIMAMNDEAVSDYTSAKEKYIKSKEICIENNYTQLLMLNYNGIGNTWVLESKDYETSEKFYKKSLHLADSLDHDFKYDVIVNIVWNRLDNKQPEKVTDYLDDLKFITTLNIEKHDYNRTLVSTAYLLLGRYYGQIEQYILADLNFNKAIEVLDGRPLHEQLSEVYLYKSSYEEVKGSHKKAYKYLKKYIKNKDSFINKDIKKRLMVENTRYKLNEYERALVISKREKILLEDLAKSKSRTAWLYSILSVFLLVLVIIIYRENKIKNRLITTLNRSNKDLKKAKKEAEIAAKIKADFISNISHEIRTPLHGVVGITSLLLDENDTSTDNTKMLNSLKFSGNYLLELINNILFLNKMDQGKIKIKEEVIDLDSFLDNILAATQFSAKKYQCEVVFRKDPKLPQQIITDSSILYEVLLNLTENAIKFSKGSVSVEVNVSKGIGQKLCLQFKVIDNGIGIPEDKQEMIFEEFSQVSMDKSIMEGTGIGLSIVKKLLLLMNSDIELESEIGKGSVFFFEITCEKPIIEELKKNELLQLNQLKGKKIIHIEDNQINCLVVEKFLSTSEVSLMTFVDGKEGLEALMNEDWDIALIDINVPSLNGYEITSAVRKIHPTKPMITVTASELSEVKEKAMNAGTTDVLIKPFNKKSLLAIINKYL